MAETYKKLGQGQLGRSVAVLYTVPADTSAIVKKIVLVNNDSEDLTVELNHDGDTEATRILPPITIDAGGWAEFDGSICMEAADTLQGKGEQATEITYTIYGLEIS